MAEDYLRVSYYLQELEEINGKILCDLVIMARLTNISLGIMARTTSREDVDINIYFHSRRTIEHLQHQAKQQIQLLGAVKDDLIHARDSDMSEAMRCVLFDYEKAEAV